MCYTDKPHHRHRHRHHYRQQQQQQQWDLLVANDIKVI